MPGRASAAEPLEEPARTYAGSPNLYAAYEPDPDPVAFLAPKTVPVELRRFAPVAKWVHNHPYYCVSHHNSPGCGSLKAECAFLFGGCLALLLALVPTAAAQDKPVEVSVTLEKQKFTPEEVKVKAGQPFLLVVTNKDAKPAEVESKDLRFEKVVAPGKTISIRVRALKPGTYVFLDDYNKSTRGKIVAE